MTEVSVETCFLNLKVLSFSSNFLLMLLPLVSGQRGQSIHLLEIQHVKMEEDLCSVDVVQYIKTSRPRAPHTRIKIASYPPELTISSYSCLREYIQRTQKLRGTETMLFISYVKPYKPSLGTPFLDGLKPLLKHVALTLLCSLHTAPGQPLRPKRVRRQSLYTRLWPRLVSVRHKHFIAIILSQ